ncbi:hybrid sensor histidine kinase/response regulator [Anaerosporobacter faecicola]|uniref:hybrid sensor histidine kinase/response regulator n=1 Tax=Anaerosporobacter faecicola TaxID=2718714 RepID=UPI00143C9F2F|nr:ATP-binding protein [Anaerosporobacter faecicola]
MRYKTLDGLGKKALLDSIPGAVAIYRLSKNGIVRTDYISQGLANMCGYERAEDFFQLLKEDALSNLVEEDIPKIKNAIEIGLENNETICASYRFYTTTKKELWIRLDANIIRDYPIEENDIAAFYAVHTLMSKEAILYQDLCNQAIENIYVINPHTHELLYMNEAMKKVTNTNEIPTGCKCYEKIFSKDKPCEFCCLKHTKPHTIGEMKIKEINHTYLVHYENLPWGKDEATAIYTIEYTEQSQYREHIMAEREKYRLILDSMELAFCEWDKEGNFFASEFYQKYRISEKSDHRVLDEKVAKEMIYPDDLPLFKQYMQDMLHKKKKVSTTLRCKRKDNIYRWTEIAGYQFFDEAGNNTQTIGIIRDVDAEMTKYKEMEARLSDAVKQANVYLCTYDIKNNILYQFSDRPLFPNAPEKLDDPLNLVKKYQLIDPRDQERFFAYFEELCTTKENQLQIEFRILQEERDSTANQWIRINHTILRNPQGEPQTAWGVVRGIDAEKIAEERFIVENTKRYGEEKDLLKSIVVDVTKNQVLRTSSEEGDIELKTYITIEEMYHEMSKNYDFPWDGAIFTRSGLLQAYNSGEEKSIAAWGSGIVLQHQYIRINVKFLCHPRTEHIIAFIYIYNETKKQIQENVMRQTGNRYYDFLAVVNLNTDEYYTISQCRRDPNDRVPESGYLHEIMKERLACYDPKEVDFAKEQFTINRIAKRLDLEEDYSFILSMRMNDGSIMNKQYQFFRVDDAPEYVCILCSDVTNLLKKNKQQKDMLERALLQAQTANIAKSNFLSRMSHDMRTPMNAILGLSNLAMDMVNIDELKDYMAKINESGQYLLELINEVLDVTRIEAGKMMLNPERTRSKELLNAIINPIKITARRKGIQFIVNVTGVKDHTLYVDALQLKKVFVNLLSNAVKFTPVGGTVTLQVELLKEENSYEYLSILVRDTGIGMDEAFIPHIFEPFTQENLEVRSNYEGSGLGMTIVKNIVDLLGGKIEICSKKNQGTRIKVWLPLLIKDEEGQKSNSDTSLNRNTEKKKEDTQENLTRDLAKNQRKEYTKQQAEDQTEERREQQAEDQTEERREQQAEDQTEQLREQQAEVQTIQQVEQGKDPLYNQTKVPKRILLCEDQPLNAKIAQKMLERVGYQVETAENGKIGVKMYEDAQSGYYDMILMDVRMPVMDGLTATRNIREMDKADAKVIPIIALTANAFEEDVCACMDAGMNAHLGKPIEPDKLYKMMKQWTEGWRA